MTCKKCGRDAADGCVVCPYCLEYLDPSASQAAVRRRRTVRRIIIAAAVVAAFAAAAVVLFLFTGCAAQPEADASSATDAIVSFFAEDDEESPDIQLYGTGEYIYAGSPVTGTWVLLEDYLDGFDDWDDIAEYTSDGLVYEWYGDGLGYYEPLCGFDYYGDKIVYHYDSGDSEYSCTISGRKMTTTDSHSVSSEFIRISEDINLSVAEVKALYQAESDLAARIYVRG